VIIVDRALEQRQAEGRPIQVGMVGAGFMGRGIALQMANWVTGMRLAAIANRSLEAARRAYLEAGVPEEQIQAVASPAQMGAALARGQVAITADPALVCQAAPLEAVIEVTGTVEEGAHTALAAIEHGKHIILMNAELDGTVGPVLKQYADRAGVIFTNCDGDQPGVMMNLYRFVRGLGVRPVLCGNIKGLHDPYRNPTTQEGFARRWGQRPSMVTSFADGTKISFEQAIVANATGMRVAQRGMWGPTVPGGTPVAEAAKAFPVDQLLEAGPGFVDYLVGAEPSPGVFVLGTHSHPQQQHYLNLYKLGQGPLYCFYTPYHLCHFEVPNTVARAVLFGDAAIAPRAGPCVDVVAAAKTDLRAGQNLDGLGEYMTYGLAENSDVVRAENLLPIGLAQGGRLLRDIPKDQVLKLSDVALPEGRLVDRLRAEQNELFWPALRAPAMEKLSAA
jgi:predicted homoserine dehydrogenase-like protein